jgi:hypothetical protein
MVELPNNEDFAPHLNFSVKRSLLAYLEPDDYVLPCMGSICTDDDTEIGRLLGYIIQVNRAVNEEQDLFEANATLTVKLRLIIMKLFLTVRRAILRIRYKSNWA